jgi:hypothetical protein
VLERFLAARLGDGLEILRIQDGLDGGRSLVDPKQVFVQR